MTLLASKLSTWEEKLAGIIDQQLLKRNIKPLFERVNFTANRLAEMKAWNIYPGEILELEVDVDVELPDYDPSVPLDSVVTLSQAEQNICANLARGRFMAARAAGKPNAKQGPQSNEFTDLEGLGGELAFAKLFNLYPVESFQILPRSTKEDRGDFTLRNGKTVDVKSTKYRTGKLQAALWKSGEDKPKVDLYCLMVGQMPTYRFAGFMACDDLCRDSRIGTFPGRPDKPCYMVGQSELKTLEQLR